jgi:hypothetical protein
MIGVKNLRRNSSLSMNRMNQNNSIQGTSNKGSEADSNDEYIITPSNNVVGASCANVNDFT